MAIANKWEMTSVLAKDKELSKCLPATLSFSVQNLQTFLNQYSSVVLKPMVEKNGNGLILVTKNTIGYQIVTARISRQVTDFNGLLRIINSIKKDQSYKIEQAIKLASINGRPVDYRINMHYSFDTDQWRLTRIYARLAKSPCVTNLSRNGSKLIFSTAVARSLGAANVEKQRKETILLVQKCIRRLKEHYVLSADVYFDFGFDERGRVWIFEANSYPL